MRYLLDHCFITELRFTGPLSHLIKIWWEISENPFGLLINHLEKLKVQTGYSECFSEL